MILLICRGRLLLRVKALLPFHDGTRPIDLLTLGWNKYSFPLCRF